MLLEEVFGESSDSEPDEQRQFLDHATHSDLHELPLYETNPNWERFTEVNGLWLCRDFLSPQHQSSLLSAIENEGFFTKGSCNQAMRFGDLPPWAKELSRSIRKVVCYSDYIDGENEACLLSSDLLWREPLFDQLIINVYQPGEGICAHVDLLRFEDGISIVSLESSCVMHFTCVGDDDGEGGKKIPVYLTPGSLVLMSGEARYHWKHEINRKPGFQLWDGQEIIQKRRTSITLRRLRQVES